ncbi:YetF domain-containing protein [Aquipuribacter sp. MA13-6]
MRGQRLTEGEVRQAVRASGTGDLARVAAVVLESDGTLSVIGRSDAGDLSAATDVAGLHVRET